MPDLTDIAAGAVYALATTFFTVLAGWLLWGRRSRRKQQS